MSGNLVFGGNSTSWGFHKRGNICLTIVNKMAAKAMNWSFAFEVEKGSQI